ncbi:GH1 family beta-glucosidase [Microlunatus antarcticus]|uniref:Beta-glucosidase n=1 Tax=Microlunatus antarcticus TaxID=53388 RepID=A0A7W5JUR5_9ACTN|nr:beta-glucosidase [Microlunatus antarcticus]
MSTISTTAAPEPVTFPDGFGWGTATASYQIEGAVGVDGRSPSVWDTFSHTPGMITDGSNGDRADDHYYRYAEDVELMADLGTSFYRFSFAWPRLQPDGHGKLNPAGLAFYDRLTNKLLERGITPWVTLYHWDLPQVLEDAGGWPVRDTALRFADYSTQVFDALKDKVEHWTTLNEPFCAGLLSYAAGQLAPGRNEPVAGIHAVHHLLLGHGLALQAMRTQAGPEHQFGLTLNLSPVAAATDSEADADAARRIDALSNRLFLDPILKGSYPEDLVADLAPLMTFDHVQAGDLELISQPIEALGINYYMKYVVRAGRNHRYHGTPYVGSGDVEFVGAGLPRSARGWEINPDGLYELLTHVSSAYDAPPLWITENGIALDDVVDADGAVHDPDRIAYLDAHFRAAHRAITDGVDLRGYFIWTLTDNFEWSYGESSRFGLVHVDYETQVRTPKDSAAWYAKVTADNGLGEA